MPIPQFNAHGNLPPGEHPASWSQFQERYAGNVGRRALLEKMEEWLMHMRQAGCRTVHIDGSFIASKENPGDYDACWDATGVDAARLDPCLLDQTPQGRAIIKQRFGGDIRPDMVCPPGSNRPYLRFFQRDRDGRAKGIVWLDLSEFAP